MCQMAVVGNRSNPWLQLAGEVSDELGTPIVLVEGATYEPDPDSCLCTVDVMQMAKNAGRKCVDVSNDWDDWSFIDYVIDPDGQ